MTLLALAACAPLRSTDAELRNIRPDEGVVYGSILLASEKAEGEESSFGFLKGVHSGDATYSLALHDASYNPFKTQYTVRLEPDKVTFFVKKLPVGEYEIGKVTREGFSNLEVTLSDHTFRVTPGVVTYVGRLTMLFPNRIHAGSPVHVTIGDYMPETTETLKKDYDDGFFDHAEKGLITGEH